MDLARLCFAVVLVTVCSSVKSEEPGPDSYSSSIGESLMHLNAAVLCPTQNVAAWNCSRCTKGMFFNSPHEDIKVILEDSKNLMALVGVSDKNKLVYLVVRGTLDASVEDWLLDFEFWQRNYHPYGPHAYVHHGFLKAWSFLKAQVRNTINYVFRRYPRALEYEVAVTGHSLGGAISVVMMADFMNNQTQTPMLFRTRSGEKRKLRMYTMGQPRTGNVNFSKAFANQLLEVFDTKPYRVVNKADAVPHLPPKGNSLGAHYYHINTEVWIAPNGTTFVCNGSGEDPKCSDSLHLSQLKPSDHTGYYGLNAGPCSK